VPTTKLRPSRSEITPSGAELAGSGETNLVVGDIPGDQGIAAHARVERARDHAQLATSRVEVGPHHRLV
jgi:hypothetical protein